MAEGLLRKDLEAPLESKQDFIHHAVSYLAFARAQEQDGSSVEGISSDLLNSDDTENRYRQVRQLIKQAIEINYQSQDREALDIVLPPGGRQVEIVNASSASYIEALS